MKSVNGLYPIIRRVRRPLLPVDPPEANKPIPTSQPDDSKPTTGETSEVADEKKPNAGDTNK
jgi:hypothetical protein